MIDWILFAGICQLAAWLAVLLWLRSNSPQRLSRKNPKASWYPERFFSRIQKREGRLNTLSSLLARTHKKNCEQPLQGDGGKNGKM